MDRSNIIYLITETQSQDAIGQFVSEETKRQVFCDVRSISQSEWFEAGRSGLQPSLCFVIFAPDYQGEKILEFDRRRYGIYRTYIAKNERLELYAEEKGGVYVKETESEP